MLKCSCVLALMENRGAKRDPELPEEILLNVMYIAE
jgi:hypothetical protein